MPTGSHSYAAVRARFVETMEWVHHDPPVQPRNRSFRSVRKAALEWGQQWFPIKAMYVRKRPEDLLESFKGRFERSPAVRKLLSQPALDLPRISRAVYALVTNFDPSDVASVRGDKFFGLSRRPLDVRALRSAHRTLVEATAILREAGREDVAEEVESFSQVFADAAIEQPRMKWPKSGSGRKREEIGELVAELDAHLDPIPKAARESLVASLVSDFRRPYSQHRVRSLLDERWRRSKQRAHVRK